MIGAPSFLESYLNSNKTTKSINEYPPVINLLM